METAQVGDGVNWGEGVYWLDLEGPAQNFVGVVGMARGPGLTR